jgi:SAM-dependent methyltransferase
MRVRARIPERVKKVYRIARSLALHRPARPVPQQQLDSAQICASRYELLGRLPRGGIVAELGTRQGHFARAIMAAAQPQELHLVDPDFAKFDARGLSPPTVIRHVGRSDEIIASFPPAHFDWIYIDADRSYRGVTYDAHAAAKVLKPGGFLVFNDFAHVDPHLGRYGVMRAVTDFMIESGWEMAYFALERDALFDVALRKPGRS